MFGVEWFKVPVHTWSSICYCSAVTRDGWRWIVDAHKDDGKRYIVHSDELLSAFLELEATLLQPARYCTCATCIGGYSAIVAKSMRASRVDVRGLQTSQKAH